MLSVCEKHGPFDVVVDDGGHTAEMMQATLNTLWTNSAACLTANAVYVIEDMHVMAACEVNDYCAQPKDVPNIISDAFYGMHGHWRTDGALPFDGEPAPLKPTPPAWADQLRSIALYDSMAFFERGAPIKKLTRFTRGSVEIPYHDPNEAAEPNQDLATEGEIGSAGAPKKTAARSPGALLPPDEGLEEASFDKPSLAVIRSRNPIEGGDWTEENIEQSFIQQAVLEGDTILEIGANIGRSTIVAAESTGPHVRTLGIRPPEEDLRDPPLLCMYLASCSPVLACSIAQGRVVSSEADPDRLALAKSNTGRYPNHCCCSWYHHACHCRCSHAVYPFVHAHRLGNVVEFIHAISDTPLFLARGDLGAATSLAEDTEDTYEVATTPLREVENLRPDVLIVDCEGCFDTLLPTLDVQALLSRTRTIVIEHDAWSNPAQMTETHATLASLGFHPTVCVANPIVSGYLMNRSSNPVMRHMGLRGIHLSLYVPPLSSLTRTFSQYTLVRAAPILSSMTAFGACSSACPWHRQQGYGDRMMKRSRCEPDHSPSFAASPVALPSRAHACFPSCYAPGLYGSRGASRGRHGARCARNECTNCDHRRPEQPTCGSHLVHVKHPVRPSLRCLLATMAYDAAQRLLVWRELH